MNRQRVLLAALFAAAAGSWFGARQAPTVRGTAESPSAFEISRYNDAIVYVHLHGGAVEFEAGVGLGEKTSVPTTGEVHGRVLDPGGKPIPGVLVVGGDGLVSLHDSLRARDGAWTDEQGHFSMKTCGGREVSLVAMHHERGMSRAPRVPVGREVDLTLEPFTWIEGVVREGPDPVEARVTAQTDDMAVTVSGHTDASGHYKFGPLPPGTYDVRVRNNDPDEVIAFPVETLELRPGTTTEYSPTESDPGSVYVEFHRTPGLRVAVIGIALFEGPGPVSADAEYEAIVQGEDGRTFDGPSGLGPSHPRKLFRGLPPGMYTACARLNLGDNDMHVICESVAVDGTRPAEVNFELAAG